MNRTQSELKPEARVSNGSISNFHRAIAAIVLIAGIPIAAVAQYPGGGGGTGTYPGGAHPSYGSKGAVIGGVAAGAAVGAGLLYWKFHNHSKLQGCVAGDGDALVTEKDNQTYKLTNTQNQSLKSGQRVELLGKKLKDAVGEPTFAVRKLSKNLGQCTATNAAALKTPN
jgi:hypothetical protein